ncbi:4Fe-4S dicluster domain-containing protein [Thermincola potens]|uniref:4Fe-4S ferredoxin iron-sulfur binding domain protein n=1 Tax=Thermincola potens (strain JR) TaxID=635013 RepID=D5X7B3_THEPJ|nr:4Fe-4S dicluster domain-containing protein [Thermincola potens]ADG82483.1 4Fe-4S ferredoxin iron-sulfur binding domain protein [Thermincola potens JR]
MNEISRRTFFKRTLASIAASTLVLASGNKTAEAGDTVQYGTFIDLTRCDGCAGKDVPACVNACRQKNQHNFPQPQEPIQPYWPQTKFEDWSRKKHLTDKLTPYNWTYVQPVEVKHNGKTFKLNIPRRCMHCDNPPCANLCPFGVHNKTKEGAVVIDRDYCMGGAKCRDVCPWDIPQRQAGVGIYLKMAPKLAGGGVMYKCDLCIDLVKKGQEPSCVQACPQKALIFGEKEEMRKLAHRRAKEISGYIYGEKENGGTSTFYVSPVPFDKIHKSIMAKKKQAPKPERIGIPGMEPAVENYLDSANGTLAGYLIAPVAGAFAAGITAIKTMKGEE